MKSLALVLVAALTFGCALTVGKATPDKCVGLCLAAGNAEAGGGAKGGEISTAFGELVRGVVCAVEAAALGWLRVEVKQSCRVDEEPPELEDAGQVVPVDPGELDT